jgi:hypothetical protein
VHEQNNTGKSYRMYTNNLGQFETFLAFFETVWVNLRHILFDKKFENFIWV